MRSATSLVRFVKLALVPAGMMSVKFATAWHRHGAHSHAQKQLIDDGERNSVAIRLQSDGNQMAIRWQSSGHHIAIKWSSSAHPSWHASGGHQVAIRCNQ